MKANTTAVKILRIVIDWVLNSFTLADASCDLVDASRALSDAFCAFSSASVTCLTASSESPIAFVAFSLGDSLIKNGAGYAQVAALISTLTMVGFITLPLEAQYIGKKASYYRNLFAFLFSFIVALFIGGVMWYEFKILNK